MITDQQRELAARYVLGEANASDEQDFSAQLRANPELREFLSSLQNTMDRLWLAGPSTSPPAALKKKVLEKIRSRTAAGPATGAGSAPGLAEGLRFLANTDTGWKALPIAGAFIKLLSLEPERGYAVLLGKLDPGVRYPAHTNAGPEDFYLLSGDLHVGDQVLRTGDFHHADAGSYHTENYSVEGCTLLAVLTTDDPLVQLAMG
jgi:anti-sigma factor ChrR (cupin superfamily)